MKNSTIRSADWRDLPVCVSLTLDEAMALKSIGFRWKCKAIQQVGETAIFAIISAQCAGECGCGTEAAVIVQMTARNVVTACAFCMAEAAVTDTESGNFWRGEMRAALESLSRNLESVRSVLGF